MIISDEELKRLTDMQMIVAHNPYGNSDVRYNAQNLIYALRELRARRDADDVVKEATRQHQGKMTSGHVEEVKKSPVLDPELYGGKTSKTDY
jgi:hypothetical protein